MPEKLFNYPQPDNNPNCLCRNNPMQAFYCQTGHMLECHSGMVCNETQCGHLAGYSYGEMSHLPITNAPCFLVTVTHGLKILIPKMPVFAPSENLAEDIVRGWVKQTENMSKIYNELQFVVTVAED